MLLRGLLSILAGLGVVMMLVVVFTWTVAELLRVPANESTTASVVAHLIIWATVPIVGGYLTGRMAPSWPLLHGIGLGILLFLVSALPMILDGPQLGQPEWYPAALGVLTFSGPTVGGGLASRIKPSLHPETPDDAETRP